MAQGQFPLVLEHDVLFSVKSAGGTCDDPVLGSRDR